MDDREEKQPKRSHRGRIPLDREEREFRANCRAIVPRLWYDVIRIAGRDNPRLPDYGRRFGLDERSMRLALAKVDVRERTADLTRDLAIAFMSLPSASDVELVAIFDCDPIFVRSRRDHIMQREVASRGPEILSTEPVVPAGAWERAATLSAPLPLWELEDEVRMRPSITDAELAPRLLRTPEQVAVIRVYVNRLRRLLPAHRDQLWAAAFRSIRAGRPSPTVQERGSPRAVPTKPDGCSGRTDSRQWGTERRQPKPMVQDSNGTVVTGIQFPPRPGQGTRHHVRLSGLSGRHFTSGSELGSPRWS
jgi:hypothetical protein